MFESLASDVYDPAKTFIKFNSEQVFGFDYKVKYRRINERTHELYLQAVSGSLSNFTIGSEGDLDLYVHTGGSDSVHIEIGKVYVESLYVNDLTSSVPVVVVVLKNID